MSKRLEILKNSLIKKQDNFDKGIANHFDTVGLTNGQPLNDKCNGGATFKLWERQNNALHNLESEIEKTTDAIEREERKIFNTDKMFHNFPKSIKELISAGELIQWRKHPRIMFVKGVENARILYNEETGRVVARYFRKIKERDQFDKFQALFNKLVKELNNA